MAEGYRGHKAQSGLFRFSWVAGEAQPLREVSYAEIAQGQGKGPEEMLGEFLFKVPDSSGAGNPS